MLNLICKLTGDSPDIVRKFDQKSKDKVILLGVSWVIPVIIVTASMYMISTVLLDLNWTETFIVMATSAVVIAAVEIIIIRGSRSMLAYIFRVILAVSINLTSASAIDLALFNEDIQLEILNIKNKGIHSIQNEPTYQDTQIADLTLKINSTEKLLLATNEEYVDEVGGLTRTGLIGNGIRAKALEKMILKYEGLLELYKKDYSIKTLERESFIEGKLQKYKESKFSGILLKIKAFEVLVKKEPIIKTAWILITVLLLSLELMPLLYKISAEETAYEKNIVKHSKFLSDE